MAEDDVDRRIVEREAERLQGQVDKHPSGEVEAPPQPLGVRGGMDLPADEPHPAKHQTGVVAGEAEAGKDEDVQNEDGDPEDKEVADDQSIPELTESDDGDEKMNPVDRNFVESDDDELAAPRRPEA